MSFALKQIRGLSVGNIITYLRAALQILSKFYQGWSGSKYHQHKNPGLTPIFSLMAMQPSTPKTENVVQRNLWVGYVCVEESFDTTFNVVIGEGVES